MPPLVLLSIISVNFWLNFAHGMDGKTDEKTQTVQDVLSDALQNPKVDSETNTDNSVSLDCKPSEPEPKQAESSSEILNLEYEEYQIKFLSELIPITQNFRHRNFRNYNQYYRTIKKTDGISYIPKLNKGETICGWFKEVKYDINTFLKNMKRDNLPILPEQITTLRRLKKTIDFYLNPINGRFKASDIHKILADANCQLTPKHHKRNDKLFYRGTLFLQDGEPIDLLSNEDLQYASNSSKSIQEIFNPDGLATKEQLNKYYEKLDTQSDPDTITTRSLIYYALAHLCGAQHLEKYALATLKKKREAQERTTHETKRLIEDKKHDQITTRSNPASSRRPARADGKTTPIDKKHPLMPNQNHQTFERSKPTYSRRPATQSPRTQTLKRQPSTEHKGHQTYERSYSYFSQRPEESDEKKPEIRVVRPKPRVIRKLKRPPKISGSIPLSSQES